MVEYALDGGVNEATRLELRLVSRHVGGIATDLVGYVGMIGGVVRSKDIFFQISVFIPLLNSDALSQMEVTVMSLRPHSSNTPYRRSSWPCSCKSEKSSVFLIRSTFICLRWNEREGERERERVSCGGKFFCAGTATVYLTHRYFQRPLMLRRHDENSLWHNSVARSGLQIVSK